jgi:hypothetical protein
MGVADAPHDASQDGQSPAAIAGLAHLGEIAQGVSQQRHGVVVERRHHDAPGFPGAAGLSGVVQDFDQQALRHDMVMRLLRTLRGDQVDFHGTV